LWSETALAELPLEGVRVISLEQFGAGPWGTMQLADLGAEVIKVEDPTVGGDVGRYVPPFNEAASSLFFESFSRNKRSVAIDLRTEAGRRVFDQLVRRSDAVFSNLRGDAASRLRIQYEDLAHLNERIVCLSLSGFGNTGPRAAEGAYDVTIQALTGWMSLTGGPDEPPTKSGLSLVDFSGGYVAALALVAAVWQARRDGRGKDVDVSLFETALGLLTYMATWSRSKSWIPERFAGSAHQSVVPFQMFRASNGWLMVACAKESFWVKLCDALGHPDLAHDPRFSDMAARGRNRVELVRLLDEIFAGRSVAGWLELLGAYDVPCAPVNSIEDALTDDQARSRDVLAEYDHPVLGKVETVKSALGPALTRPVGRAPLLGEDTLDVLSDVCGYSASEVDELINAGAFGDSTVEAPV
jgi:crotonobetainyl-CoA:carnitine CoA-transferase CaiB-like acyl-CoA transferase